MGPQAASLRMTRRVSGIENAASLGHAVLAYGPVLVAQAGLFGLLEDFGQIVGETETRVAAGGGLAQQASVLGAEVDGGAGVFGRMEHHVSVRGVERRLKQRAVDGFEKHFRVDALRFSKDK